MARKTNIPLRGDERAARRGRRALRVVAESRRDCPGQRRTAERLRRGREGWVGIGAEITPKRGHQPRTIPQSRLRRASSLYTREPLGTGSGSPRRFAPRNDSPKPLSFRGGPTGRRGNPSFLRWTMDGGSGRRVVGPYGRSTKVPATGRCGHRPLRKARSTTQASRRAAKRPRPRTRGMGGNRRKDHPKRGTAPATAGAAL